MAYSRTNWYTGEPITQQRMNNIEDGINEALGLRTNINAAQSTADSATSTANTNSGRISSLETSVANLQTAVNQGVADGTNAMGQIIGATTENDPAYSDLDSRFQANEEDIQDVADDLSTLAGIVDSARIRTNGAGTVTDTFNNITDRLNNTDNTLTLHRGYITTLQDDYRQAKGYQQDGSEYPSLNARLSADESNFNALYNEVDAARKVNGTLKDHFDDIDNAITAATQSTAQGTTYSSMDARFEAIESEIVGARGGQVDLDARMDNIEGNVSGLSSNKIDTSAIANNLTTTTEGKVLDARQGKVLDEAKVNYSDVKDNLTSTDADKPLSAKQGKELKTLIDNMDTAYKAADTALDGRVTTIEGDLNTATTGLKDRMTTAEGDIDTLESDLNTTTTGLKDRMTTAEGDIDTLESDLNTAETGLKARMTSAETRLDAIDGVSGTVAGLTTRMGTAENDIDALEATINTAQTGLVAKVAALETTVNDATDGVGALATRVTTLEGKDTIVVAYDGEHSNYTNDEPNVSSPVTTADYLIADNDGKYFYWRYFGAQDGWQLISSAGGGGGTGSSSGMFVASLDAFEGENALTPDENIDYFVGNNTIGYTHYRYLVPDGAEQGTFVRILPKGLLLNASVTANGGLFAGTVENPNSNVFNTFVAIKSVDSEVIMDNGNPAGTLLTFVDTNGTSYPITVQGGGGGGSAYNVKLNNETGALSIIVPDIEGTVTNLQARAVVKEGSEIATNLGSALTVTTQYSTSSSGPWNILDTRTVNNNESFQVNVSSILRTGVKMYVRMTLTTTLDEQEYNRPINFEITKTQMSIQAINFNQATVRTGNLTFQYKCIGDGLTKVVHFKIDGVDAVTPITTDSHNDQLMQTISLAGKTTGMHSFQVYFTVNGVSSNILNYYILYNPNTSNISPMIALAAERATITYGDELKINYTTAVNPTIETMDDVVLELYTVENNVETVLASTELTNVRNERVHTWIPVKYPTSGTAYVRGVASRTIDDTVVSDTKTIEITVNELVTDYTLTYAGEENLLYSYTAYGRTNNDAGKEQFTYDYTSHASGNPVLTWTGAFNNFNWSTDGYTDGQTLTISGGATHTINVPLFSSETANNVSLEVSPESYSDPTQNGRTIEIEYEVQSATDLNDIIIDCMSNVTTETENGNIKKRGVGFQVTPQSCYLLNNNNYLSLAGDGTGTILNEDAIPAAYLTTGVRTHLAFVIEPWAAEKAYDRKYHQSVNIYINGEFANACPYNRDSNGNISDSFKTNATLRIGSASCIIKIYSIKMYNRGLTHTEILQNYKMAPGATIDKIARFDTNNVLRGGKVDYELARKKFNCLLLVGPEPVIQQNEQGQDYNAMPTISPYKGSPSPIGRSKDNEVVGKTESGLVLTYPDGNSVDGYKTEFSLLDIMTDGGYASSNNVQGTSSQKYPIHNLKIYLMKGTEGQEELDENQEPTGRYKKSEKVKYKLPGSKGKGESTLCWKADYMSTDHANTYNANIADSLFSESLNPDITDEDWQSNVQNTVHGIRCLLFKQEGTNAPEFVADGCLNNDKGNSKTYGLEYSAPAEPDPEAEYDVNGTADTVAQKWEFTNNSDDLGFFKYDCVFYPTGNDQHYRALDAFESCYPDQGDLEDAQDAYKKAHDNTEDPTLNPNYNHLQVLLTWVSQRANYWDETDPDTRAAKKEIFRTEFTKHFNLDHVLVYYLFSEYTALCDNRVKNMFMRSDTVRKERIKLLNGTVVFEGNNNPNADYWKSYTDVQTTEVNQQAIINTIASVYSNVHSLAEVETPDYAETIAAQVAADAASSTLTLAQLQALIVSYLNAEEAAVGSGYMAASTGNEYVVEHRMSHAADIDWEEGEGHSQFARWAPVLYDLDSCFGVENVGLLKVPYNADWQYFSEGQYRFNGHDSIFWLMVEDTFKNEIAAKALTLYNRSRGLNYSTFYQEQVVDNINETAPAMTNQDMLLKFDAPWATGFMNYANKPPTYETPEYKYLQRGTRTAQKTSFLFKRSMLLSSKYQASAFLNDKISFRYGADLTANQAIIECSANQIMYPAVSFGDNKGWTQALELTNGTPVVGGLVNAGDTCRIRATSSAKGQDTLFIAGASVLTDIGDLSIFKPYELKVGQGRNLKRLIIGSNAAGYTNAVTSTIENLSACSILEEINIRNCTAFTSLDLSANGLIKRVYAAGSGAGTISLPAGGVLDTIEYSTAVSNITILNHIYLQHFTCEVESGESEAQYSNLNKLWIENTPNVPIVDIIKKRMGSLTNGVRLVGIDVNLGNDPTFLQVITSSLAEGKYLDSTGSLNITKTPYISGTVYITSIRESLVATLHDMYPDLTIIANEEVREFEIKYENYDGTLLFTDHGTNEDDLKDPVVDINPVTGLPYISMPTKPEDAQYSYRFGTYDNSGNYRKFSGWVRKGTTTNPTNGSKINGSITLVAVYPTQIKQTYTVTWYDDLNGRLLNTVTVEYGNDLSSAQSPVELGILTRTKSTGNGIKVFTGWSRPLGKIIENTSVYALWQTSTINDATDSITLSQLTAADLYALSLTENSTKKHLLEDNLGQVIMVPMGQDFNYVEGVQTTNLLGAATELELDGTTTPVRIFNDITPLSSNKDWTLAIDYKFLLNSGKAYFTGREYVLASCYRNANSSVVGFKVSMLRDTSGNGKHSIQVTWGTESVTIDYACSDNSLDDKMYFNSYRNVVVLSHNSDEPNKLRVSYVYPDLTYSWANQSSANNNTPYGSKYGTYVTNTLLTYDSNTTIDTPLIIGGNYNGSSTSIENDSNYRQPAEAIIHWAKYWTTDLGESNCTKLASWIHETVPFYLNGYNGSSEARSTEQVYSNTSLSFVAAQGLGDRYAYSSTATLIDSENKCGWHISAIRTLCNNLIYQGMREEYKSVISRSAITTIVRGEQSINTDSNTVSSKTTQDYLFLPAVREVDPNATNQSTYGGEVNTQWLSPWSWITSGDSINSNIYSFISGSSQIVHKVATTINSYLYRFLGHYITNTARIYTTGNTDPTTINNFQLQDENGITTSISVRSGDVWVDSSGDAYMYFTNEEIAKGVKVFISTANGGWKRADMWNLRSINASNTMLAENSFMRVEATGSLNQLAGGTTGRADPRLICPEFTI